MRRIGQTYAGYEILAPLGAGGMGEVYRAHQKALNRDVAVKFISEEFCSDENIRRRFLREIRAASTLSHPNIVKLYDSGEQDKDIFLVMEFLDGKPLETFIQKAPRGLPCDFALKVVEDVLEALAFMHPRGFIHRDIKPANIMLTRFNRAVLMDFGLVKIAEDSQITRTGKLVGTPRYLSPEMLMGGTCDHRSDLYQVGLVLCEAVCGRIPFKQMELLEYLKGESSVPPRTPQDIKPDLDAPIAQLINNALGIPLDERYQEAREMLEDLGRAREGTTVSRLIANQGPRSPRVTVGESEKTPPGLLRPGTGYLGPSYQGPRMSRLTAGLQFIGVRAMVPRPWIVGFLGTLVALALGILFLSLPPGTSQTRVSGFSARFRNDRAHLHWTTNRPAPTGVELGVNEESLELIESTTSPLSLDHSIVTPPLAADTTYRCRVLLSKQDRGPLYEFRTPRHTYRNPRVRYRGLTATLDWTTDLDVRCSVEWIGSSAASTKIRLAPDPMPTQKHRAVLSGPGLVTDSTVEILSTTTTGSSDRSSPFPIDGLSSRATHLEMALKKLDLVGLLRRWSLQPTRSTKWMDAAKKQVARLQREHTDVLDEILLGTPEILDSSAVPFAVKSRYYRIQTELYRLGSACSALLGEIPPRLAVSRGRLFSVGSTSQIQTSVSIDLRPPRLEGQSDEIRFELPSTPLDRAEFVVQADYWPSTWMLTLSVNGQIDLVLRAEGTVQPAGPGPSTVELHHSFDAAALLPGQNKILLGLSSIFAPCLEGARARAPLYPKARAEAPRPPKIVKITLRYHPRT